MTDRKKLREAAEKAADPQARAASVYVVPEFLALCTPQAIIALLDELDRQEPVAEVRTALEPLLRALEAERDAAEIAGDRTRIGAITNIGAAFNQVRKSLAAPSPAIGRETVTEEMVERGCEAYATWWNSQGITEGQRDIVREHVRRTLVAALGAQP